MAFRPTIMGTHGMIATEHYLSAFIGATILRQGGNAVDAAVAAIFAEGVVNPHMHTLGGEVPMLISSAATGQVVALNGNTAAPQRATIDWFTQRGMTLIPGEGLLAAGVPAACDALLTALERFRDDDPRRGAATGTRLWPAPAFRCILACVAPATTCRFPSGTIRTNSASSGPPQRSSICPRGACQKWGRCGAIPTWPRPSRFSWRRSALPLLRAARPGCRRRERCFIVVRSRSTSWRFPSAMVAFSNSMTWRRLRTKVETPASVLYRGYEVFKCGPWSQGPVFLQQLRLLEGYDLRALGHNSTAYIHTVTEASKLAFADREAYYGDPDFVHVPLPELLSDTYTAARRQLIDPDRAALDLRPGEPYSGAALRSGQGPLVGREWQRGTVHVAVVDSARNLVAATPSGAWLAGSPVVEGLGFPLTTRIQVFYLDPHHPNALAPRKRPRTTLTPSLVLRDGKPFMAFGTMGLDQQDQWTLQFFLNVVDFGMPLQEAIEAPKFSSRHFPSSVYPHTASPGLLRIEGRIPYEVQRALQAKGHDIALQPDWIEGYIVGVQVDTERGVVYGGADPRGELSTLLPAYAIGW